MVCINYNQIDKNKLKKDSLFTDYLSFKESNPDGVLLYRMGVFYDTYFEDARIASKVASLTLNLKASNTIGAYHQAGIAVNSLLPNIKLLLEDKVNVYLCEQVGSIVLPGKKNKKIIRKVIRKFTPGTVFEKELLDSIENNYLLALYFDNGIYNLAYADCSTGQFYKTQGNEKQIKFEIQKIDPREVIASEEQYALLHGLLEEYNVNLLKEENFKNIPIEDVVVNYCKNVQMEYYVELDTLQEYEIEKYLTLDNITRINLELTRTRRQLKKKGSLFWFLNYTKTTMGSRLLKKFLDEPLLDIKEIKKRQDTISELVKHNDLLKSYETTLDNFCDLSRICAKICNSTIKPKELITIALSSKEIKMLYNLSKTTHSKFLQVNKEKLDKILYLSNEIKKAINKEDGLINKDYSPELDDLRERLCEKIEELHCYEARLKRKLGLQELEIESSEILNYCIKVPKNKARYITGSEFLMRQASTNHIRYTTSDLQTLEQKINDLKYKILEIEKDILNKIKIFAKNFIETIRELAKEVARIDVMTALARCAIDNDLTRPKFSEKNGICLHNAFHPSLIKLNIEIIKNDTTLENGSMIILTGANMSGKSTFLKYNAIIPILGQMGSFVPAESSDLSIVDKIFLRQSSTDDILNNNSSFMVEMNDLKFIIDNTTNCSLILLDEPAKSTNIFEGGAIVKAFCEYILKHHNTKTIIVTHNTDITTLEDKFPDKIFNYMIGNPDEYEINDRIIRRGVAKSSSAINTAIVADLPEEIINSAKEYMNISPKTYAN